VSRLVLEGKELKWLHDIFYTGIAAGLGLPASPVHPCFASVWKKLQRAVKPIKADSAKDKARALQYWVCEHVASILGLTFNQNDDSCPIHSREMGQHGADVIIRGAATISRFPFSIECKNQEEMSLAESIRQAKANRKEGTDWLVVHKKKDLPSPVVIMDWSTFERMQKMILGRGPSAGCPT